MMLLAILLTVLFVGLKLTGIIAWSWLLVFCPIPVLLIGLILLAAITVIFGAGIVSFLFKRVP